MKQIIIADDDPGVRDVFGLILTQAGYFVTLYSSGEVLLNNQFTPPNLFIIDKQLSGVDGLEVCKFLKQNQGTKDIPVLMTSASPNAARIAGEAGADGFLEKPFKMQALIKLIQDILRESN